MKQKGKYRALTRSRLKTYPQVSIAKRAVPSRRLI